MNFQLVLIYGLFFFPIACATRGAPVLDSNLAYVALQSAKKANAAKWAPQAWEKAEEYCREGKILFDSKMFAEAAQAFEQCRQWSERAENQSRIEQWKKGETF